jgi:hypothetical protein
VAQQTGLRACRHDLLAFVDDVELTVSGDAVEPDPCAVERSPPIDLTG